MPATITTIKSGLDLTTGYYATSPSSGRNVATDSTGRIWTAYYRRPGVTYTQVYAAYSDNQGQTWTEELVDQPNNKTERFAVIAIDGDDQPHVIWAQRQAGAYAILHSYRVAGVWQAYDTVQAGATTTGLNPASCSDSDGNIHVLWRYSDGTCRLKYNVWSGGSWGVAEEIESGASLYYIPQICVDDSGLVHALWVRDTVTDSELRYAYRDAGGWSAIATWESAVLAAVQDYGPSIAADGLGKVHASWAKSISAAGDDWTIHYRRYDGTSWAAIDIVDTLVSFDANTRVHNTSIQICADDEPSIVAITGGVDADDPAYDNIYYWKRSVAGAWSAREAVTSDALFQSAISGDERHDYWAWGEGDTSMNYSVKFGTKTVAARRRSYAYVL